MPAVVQEWLNLLVRWVHVVAAIMWIGDSFLFMWLDSHISPLRKPREGDAAGELWMTHSGAFYEVIKRKSLRKEELPPTLYWFKWESYTTAITGFFLLIIVYWLNSAALLLDVSSPLSPAMGIALSFSILPVSFIVYEMLWKTPLSKSPPAFLAVALLAVYGIATGLAQVFSPRAVFLQIGAMLATIMTANVRARIIPSQKHMLAMTEAGQPVDTSYGVIAKGRSVQNHYLTLPVLFTMLSNHFPSLYGAPNPALVLVLLFGFGVGLKYFMNKRAQTNPAILGATVLALGAVFFLTRPTSEAANSVGAFKDQPPVSYATVHAVLETRCNACHTAKPTNPMFAAPPLGITFDTPEQVSRQAERIFIRAVTTRTMPLGNLTGMTEDERKFLGAWFAQGADVKAPGESQLGNSAPLDPSTGSGLGLNGGSAAGNMTPADEAKATFKTICSTCHGETGNADGVASAALNPKPQSFTDIAWQAKVTDEELSKAILKGGPAVGRSPLMPANPQFETKPEVVSELVKIVRGFGAPKP
jgi:uncharacterized membrane protein